LHKPVRLQLPFYKSSLILNIENVSASKKVIANGAIGSKSTNKNYEIISKQHTRKQSEKIKKGKRSGYNK
jgi:hypothetical protein